MPSTGKRMVIMVTSLWEIHCTERNIHGNSENWHPPACNELVSWWIWGLSCLLKLLCWFHNYKPPMWGLISSNLSCHLFLGTPSKHERQTEVFISSYSIHPSQFPISPLSEAIQHSVLPFNKGPSSYTQNIHTTFVFPLCYFISSHSFCTVYLLSLTLFNN